MSKKKCILCENNRINQSDYCAFHSEIKAELSKSFKIWYEAYGELSMEKFLQKILNLSETGEDIKIVARHLLLKEEKIANVNNPSNLRKA